MRVNDDIDIKKFENMKKTYALIEHLYVLAQRFLNLLKIVPLSQE